ncbi:MAG: helix-turn-helix transcriptional regulator [Chloroflexi bacterium]|nr:helix-turn-helix transcriptional regulator [Chloroflexota bacterium]
MARTRTTPPLPDERLRHAPSLGAELRRLREAWRLSQTDVATKLGVTQRVISRIENNYTQDIRASILIGYGALVGLTPNAVARMAGWWTPLVPEDISNPKWDYIINFLGSPRLGSRERERFIDLAFAACRAVQSMEATGGMERYVS